MNMKTLLLAVAVVALAGCGGSSSGSSVGDGFGALALAGNSSFEPTPFGSTYLVINPVDGATISWPVEPSPAQAGGGIVMRIQNDGLYYSISEITQYQWSTIMGSSPWLGIPAATAATITGTEIPAYGVTYNDATAFATALQNRSGLIISLPTEAQWRALVGGEYAWGSSLNLGTIASHAVVAETRGQDGPTTARTRSANATGLYDLTGNVREWTQEGTLVGGSWMDNVVTTGSSNFLSSVARTQSHPASGLRILAFPR